MQKTAVPIDSGFPFKTPLWQKRKGVRKEGVLTHFLFCIVHFYYTVLVINTDSRLPIVLFVGQHFSGSLFKLIITKTA